MEYGHWLANTATAMNLVMGLVSIELTYRGEYLLAALAIGASMVFDGLDGRIARMFSPTGSEFGKQLDSICDVVSFGAAPAFLVYKVLSPDFTYLSALAALIFAVCGALRLARFNITPAMPGKGFTGMPITAAGGILAFMSLRPQLLSPLGLLIFTFALAFIMVSTIRYPDFKGLKLPKNRFILFGLIGLILALAILIKFYGRLEWLLILLFIYALSGPVYTYMMVKSEDGQ